MKLSISTNLEYLLCRSYGATEESKQSLYDILPSFPALSKYM